MGQQLYGDGSVCICVVEADHHEAAPVEGE